ncbi:unnamed protein product [Owenia fusiformis]|uniref:Disease resistance R13L4/SHOC-2-like LRR domain-containing protein n=1 Tax=Owenia fusiformis TaxID=6347 RepID=A0A8J1YAD7_OWEFU|nr:unnamed protein product [Owenia fusiformis]
MAGEIPYMLGHMDDYSGQNEMIKSPRTNPRRMRIHVTLNKEGLVELNLAHRDFREAPKEIFNFSRIEILKLHGNKIRLLSSAVSHLHHLKVLDLHNNELISLPDTITNCHYIQELHLHNNHITSLPARFSNFKNLHTLNISHNQFESIPHAVGECHNLRYINLEGNRLWHLPFSLQSLRHMKHINLSSNLFEEIPFCVCAMKNVETLNMKNNKLLNVPSEMGNLKHLKDLNIGGNKMETIPPIISTLKNLHVLNIADNKLRYVPPRLTKLTKLVTLQLQGNELLALPNNLESLEYLNIADNRMKHFSVNKMKRLSYLNANNNDLESMPVGIYNLPNLERLKLNGNRISYISQDIILLKDLKTLDLGNNKLTSLPQVIDELDNLEFFNIKGNKVEHRGNVIKLTDPDTNDINSIKPTPRSHCNIEVPDESRPPEQNHIPVSDRIHSPSEIPDSVYDDADSDGQGQVNNARRPSFWQKTLSKFFTRNRLRNSNPGSNDKKYKDEINKYYKKYDNHGKNQHQKTPKTGRKGYEKNDHAAAHNGVKPKHNLALAAHNSPDSIVKPQFYNDNETVTSSLMATVNSSSSQYRRRQVKERYLMEQRRRQNEHIEQDLQHHHKLSQHDRHSYGFSTKPSPVSLYTSKPDLDESTIPLKTFPSSTTYSNRQLVSSRSNGDLKYKQYKAHANGDIRHKQPTAQHNGDLKLKHRSKSNGDLMYRSNQFTPNGDVHHRNLASSLAANDGSTIRHSEADITDIDTENLVPDYPTGRKSHAMYFPKHKQYMDMAIDRHGHYTHGAIQSDTELEYTDTAFTLNTSMTDILSLDPDPLSHPTKPPQSSDFRKSPRPDYMIDEQERLGYHSDGNHSNPHRSQYLQDEPSRPSYTESTTPRAADYLNGGERVVKGTDFKLLGVCNQVEALLNEELLQPVISHKGLFNKNFIDGQPQSPDHGVISPDLERRKQHSRFGGLHRLKKDCYYVTNVGGVYRSRHDPNIRITYPVRAVLDHVELTMQIERVDQEVVLGAKKTSAVIDNILSIGDIVHITHQPDTSFMEPITLMIPAPPIAHKGRLHVVRYNRDNTVVPAQTGYRMRNGYIMIQTWHFSGYGAVLTKEKCKYKACRSVEQFLRYCYLE